MNKNVTIFIFFFIIFIHVPTSKASCEAEIKNNDDVVVALKYKIGAVFSILFFGAIGVCLPILGRNIAALHPESNFFFILKAFASGVILATAFIHILPEAFENLTSPCLPENPWGKFPFTGFVAMLAAIITLLVDSTAMGYINNKHLESPPRKDEEMGEVHNHAIHGHAPGGYESVVVDENLAESQLRRHRIISKVLEIGIVVHSVIIGISMGASDNSKTVRPLLVALSFHQLFEGIGLGGCISQAKESRAMTAIMVLFFSLTTPVGIAIGIGIAHTYSENSQMALITEGILNAASAGILIYMSLVDLLAADFMSLKMQTNLRLRVGAYISLLVGAGCMSLLAIWA